MVRTAKTNSTNSPPGKNSDGEWTTIPIKPRLLVSFPKRPTDPTLHMLVMESHFAMGTNKWIWHCYIDDKNLGPNPRGHDRDLRIQKAFVKSGNFFAERGIVLHSLNISTPRVVELFFGSSEDLWKADALAEEYSWAMTGGDNYIRRMENTGKMVCHGVRLPKEYTSKFVGRYNLEEERLRELEDMNPVFDSHGKRILYRIRCVHYMSSRTSKEKLARTGETWAVTFSDFRVPEFFIDGYEEFNFFVGPCAGGLKWYRENPFRFPPNPKAWGKGPGSPNGSANVSGTGESSTAGANKRVEKSVEGLVLSENPEQAKSTLGVGVCTTEQNKPENQILTSHLEQAGSPEDVKATSTEQQESEMQPITTAATGGFNQAVVAGKPGVQMLTTATTDGLKQVVIAKEPEAQAPTNALTKQATNTAAAKINTAEQQKPQPSQHLAKATPTSTSISARDKAPKKKGAKGAKITPPAKEPTGGDSGKNKSVPAALAPALAIQTANPPRATQPSRQHRHPNPRHHIAATAATMTSTPGVSAGRGEATTTSVDTSQLGIEKMPSSEATEKRRQTRSAHRKRANKKRANKEAAATGAAGGGEVEMGLEKGFAQGVSE